MSLILRQTGAMFLDAYRELNARKLFWITLLISGVVVAAFAAIGVNERGITFLWWTIPTDFLNSRIIEPRLLYRFAFTNFAIPLWLTWAATILALISTASLIPDFVAGGAIELSVSKPISRARLILTKFLTGLTFAALQVTVFTAACFLVIGIRGGDWSPDIFLAIPIVVLFYSYLYSFCALLGLLTRSTIASLLLTLLFWFLVFGVNITEIAFLQGREMNAMRIETIQARLESLRAQEARQQEVLDARPAQEEGQPPDQRAAGAELALSTTRAQIARRERSLEEAREWQPSIELGHRIAYWSKLLLPKTTETVELLDRYLLSQEELDRFREGRTPPPSADGDAEIRVNPGKVERRVEDELRSRTLAWVVGTSLAFEGVMLLLLIGIFRRRDF